MPRLVSFPPLVMLALLALASGAPAASAAKAVAPAQGLAARLDGRGHLEVVDTRRRRRLASRTVRHLRRRYVDEIAWLADPGVWVTSTVISRRGRTTLVLEAWSARALEPVGRWTEHDPKSAYPLRPDGDMYDLSRIVAFPRRGEIWQLGLRGRTRLVWRAPAESRSRVLVSD